MPRPSGRNAILEAAEKVVVRDGAAHLTLDSVAESAGLSKGGVLYHFPNKSALLAAMLERLLAGYEERRCQYLEEMHAHPDSDFQAELAAGLEERPETESREVGAAILAVLANEPALIAQGREFHARQFDRCCGEGLQDIQKALLLLAMSGFHLLELMQLSPFGDEERARIRAHILAEGERISPGE
mgnify:CR=1 FL=1